MTNDRCPVCDRGSDACRRFAMRLEGEISPSHGNCSFCDIQKECLAHAVDRHSGTLAIKADPLSINSIHRLTREIVADFLGRGAGSAEDRVMEIVSKELGGVSSEDYLSLYVAMREQLDAIVMWLRKGGQL